MRRNTSSSSHRDEKRRSSHTEDASLQLRTKEELARVRREWRIQQERQEAHERLKEKKILEFELQRARKIGLPLPRRSYRHSRSRSESPPSRHRRASPCKSQTPVLPEKPKPLTGGMPLFKGPEGTQISSTELRKIKVDIYRNIPGKSTVSELERDIVNPEDVVVKRRAGEGAKPIFEREELIRPGCSTEVEERRTVVTVKDSNLENKPHTSKRRSRSLSPTRTRSDSRRRTSSSHHFRHEDYKRDGGENHRSKRDRSRERSRGRSRERSRGRSRERKEDRRRTESCHLRDEEKRLKERSRRRDNSRSRERDSRYGERSRERRMPAQQMPLIEQIPIPIYYGNFPPRPVMVGPLVPIRGQVGFGGSRHPMWPMRPFGPRFPSGIDMYRLRPPGNPRGFGPRY